jgi:hypothetical protein
MSNNLKIVIDDVETCPPETIQKFINVLEGILKRRNLTTPAPIDAEVREALADVELCMRDYAYDPLLGRKLRKHLTTIRAALKNQIDEKPENA